MISILSKAATWSPEQPFGEAFSRVFSSRLCSAQLIWTAVIVDQAQVSRPVPSQCVGYVMSGNDPKVNETQLFTRTQRVTRNIRSYAKSDSFL